MANTRCRTAFLRVRRVQPASLHDRQRRSPLATIAIPAYHRVMTDTAATEIIVHDRMQSGYRYLRTMPPGKGFAEGFSPGLSPPIMLQLGVFGGKYMTDCAAEFPAEWFATAKLSPARADATLNYFGVLAGQPLAEWRRKGWIHPDDPRGWFQWYCRYWMGRRHEDDARQIGRWRNFARHAAQVRRYCEPGDPFCRPRQRQALLQWAYDARDL